MSFNGIIIGINKTKNIKLLPCDDRYNDEEDEGEDEDDDESYNHDEDEDEDESDDDKNHCCYINVSYSTYFIIFTITTTDQIIAVHNVSNIYHVPLILFNQGKW